MAVTYSIGVVGYSGQKFDTSVAEQLLAKAFDEAQAQIHSLQTKLRNTKVVVAVVSGLTDLGIPALAYREAAKRGWKTVGVACKKAEEYDCYPCDERHIVGDNWGDESPTFLKMLDAFIRIGGGKQSLAEAEEAKQTDGMFVLEYELAAEPKT